MVNETAVHKKLIGQLFVCLSSQEFIARGREIFKKGRGLSSVTLLHHFKALLEVPPLVCNLAWNILGPSLPAKTRPKHLLWALVFLKVYTTEHRNCKLTGADEKTFRL